MCNTALLTVKQGSLTKALYKNVFNPMRMLNRYEASAAMYVHNAVCRTINPEVIV